MQPIERFEPEVVRRCWIMIGAITLVEAVTIAIFPSVFLPPILRHAGEVGPIGWALAGLAALVYIAYSVRGLDLGRYLFAFPAFRILGPLMAVPTSILEEVFFRQSLMDIGARYGLGAVLQIAVSALIFGIAHALWGVRGGWRAFSNAIGSTTLLGIMLGVVYLASGRIVLPCIVAHFAINVVIEPWLVYVYVRRALGIAQT